MSISHELISLVFLGGRIPNMPEADFTYQVRTLAQPSFGIEDYTVYTSDGSRVGTVGALLDRAGTRLLLVEDGVAPVALRRRAVPWEQVERVDHDALAVWLVLDSEAFERDALELDPDKGVEEDDAEARRVTELPDELIPPSQGPAVRGPVDRPRWLEAFTVFCLFGFSTLVATIVVYFTDDNRLAALYAVPAVLAAVTAWLGYRASREPYEPRGARKS
jgi:hypothetical protein